MTDKEFQIFKVACKYYKKYKFQQIMEKEDLLDTEFEYPPLDKLVDDIANECWISITEEQTDNTIEYLQDIKKKIS